MAEHCALYANIPQLPDIEGLRSLPGRPEVEVMAVNESSGAWTSVVLRWKGAPEVLELTTLHLGERTFETHLTGFLKSLADRFRGGIDARSQAVLERVLRTKHILGCTALPNFDDAPSASQAVLSLAQTAHALVSQGPVLYDSTGRILLRDDLSSDPDAVLWEAEDAIARKQKSEERLQSLQLAPQRAMPPLDGAHEVWLRSAPEVAIRAQVLWVAGLRGEGLEQGQAKRLLDEGGLWPALTPREQAFLTDASPSPDALLQYSWGYEGVWVLLWALGHVKVLQSPTAVCDVAWTSSFLSESPLGPFVEGARLRATPELLDEADFHLRLLSATGAASEPIPAGIHRDVLWERARAFLWLMREWGRGWDEVLVDSRFGH